MKRTKVFALGAAWAALSVIVFIVAWAVLLPPSCQWDRYSVRCGRACLQLEDCALSSAQLDCERVPGNRAFQSGAWDDGAGAVPSGHVVCLSRPSEDCIHCVNERRCDQLAAKSCERECGAIEAPRPAKAIPIRR
jgi:hypothetical protein